MTSCQRHSAQPIRTLSFHLSSGSCFTSVISSNNIVCISSYLGSLKIELNEQTKESKTEDYVWSFSFENFNLLPNLFGVVLLDCKLILL